MGELPPGSIANNGVVKKLKGYTGPSGLIAKLSCWYVFKCIYEHFFHKRLNDPS